MATGVLPDEEGDGIMSEIEFEFDASDVALPASDLSGASMIRVFGPSGRRWWQPWTWRRRPLDTGWLPADAVGDEPGGFMIQWTATGVLTFDTVADPSDEGHIGHTHG
jgi:hypothetical protein